MAALEVEKMEQEDVIKGGSEKRAGFRLLEY